MARVPSYEPVAETRPLAHPGAPPLATISNAGIATTQGLAHVAQAVFAQGIEQQEHANLAAVQEAQNALGQTWYELVADPERGARAATGLAASGLTDRTLAAWDTQTRRIAGTLQNERQREAFSRIAQGRRLEVANQLATHEAAEMKRAVVQGAENAVAIAQRNAAADPATIPTARVDLARSIGAAARALGWDDETARLKFEEALSGTLTAAVDARRESDPAWAADFLAQHGAEILPEHGKALRREVAQSAARSRAEAAAREAFAAAGGDLSEGLAYLDQTYPGMGVDELDEAQRRLREKLNDQKADLALEAAEVTRAAQTQFVQRGRAVSRIDRTVIERLQTLNPMAYQSLVETQDRLSDEAFNERRLRWTPEAREAYGRFVMMPPEEKVKHDPLAEYYGLVPDAALNQMFSLYSAAQDKLSGKSEQAAEKNMVPIDRALGKIKAAAIAYQVIVPGATNKKAVARDERRMAAFTDAIITELEPVQDNLGRVPLDKLDAAIDKYRIKGAIDHEVLGLRYDTEEKFYFEATEEERRTGRWPPQAGALGRMLTTAAAHADPMAEVPSWFVEQSRAALEKKGQNPADNARILRMYRKYLADTAPAR